MSDDNDTDVDIQPVPVILVGTDNVRDVATRWVVRTVDLPASSGPIIVAAKNPRRKKLKLLPVPGSTGVVQISASNTGVPAAIFYEPNLLKDVPLELTHTDTVFAFTLGGIAGSIGVVEEMYD